MYYRPRVERTPHDASRKHALSALGLVAFALLYVSPYFPVLNNPNENVRVQMTAAIVEHGTYELGPIRERWGWVNDAACVQQAPDGTLAPCEGATPAGHTRHIYSVKSPGASLLGVPGYALYRLLAGAPPTGEVPEGARTNRRQRAREDVARDLSRSTYAMRLTGSLIPALLFAWLLYGIYRREARSRVAAETAYFGVLVGSVFLGYSYLFVSHAQSAACAFGAFALLMRARETGARFGASVLAGALAAGASFFEYPCFFVTALLCVYALFAIRPYKHILSFGFGALPPTLAVMHFQWAAFGKPWSPGHLFVENAAFRAGHERGFFGADAFHWEAAWRLLVDGRIGLFGTSPWLVLGLAGAVMLLRRKGRRLDAVFALLICGGLYTFICFMSIWDGGWTVGPRYLVALLPFFGYFALIALDGLLHTADSVEQTGGAPEGPQRRRVVRTLGGGLALGLLAASFASATVASMYYPHLMPDFDAPVSQLFPRLIALDFAPRNAGGLVGWHGSASMVPMLLLGLWILFRLARRVPNPALLLAPCIAALALAPHFVFQPPESPAIREARAFIARGWHPEGHDRATRLDVPSPTHEQLRERVGLLQWMGLEREAGRARGMLLRSGPDKDPVRAQRGRYPPLPGRPRVRPTPGRATPAPSTNSGAAPSSSMGAPRR